MEIGSWSSQSILRRPTMTRIEKGENGEVGKGQVMQLITFKSC